MPSVDCGIVLKKVPDLICYPEVVEDCKNEVEEVPFIDKERKCELLIFEDCIPVYSINQFRSVYRYIVLLDWRKDSSGSLQEKEIGYRRNHIE